MKSLCGSNQTSSILHFQTDESYQIGDKVKVSISSKVRIISALLVFGLPLISMFGFYLAAIDYLAESYAIILGFLGLIVSFFVIRMIDKKIGNKINFELGGKYEDMP